MLAALPPVPWSSATAVLLDLARRDLTAGSLPRPRLTAHAGGDGLGLAELRPHAADVVPPLLELLALFLPLGADRLTLAVVGRAWSLDDPVVPVCRTGDLRQRVLVVLRADAHRGRCRLSGVLYPIESVPGASAEGPWRLGAAVRTTDEPEGRTGAALQALLDGRARLLGTRRPHQLATQYARVLLLGHRVSVTDGRVEQLLADTVALP
ncbi:hypothetical protein [Egicoccus halophilus]|uniref:Uncharacterized protein n=1 Tax=Egicoccus halophilus TaxID=1670830 RepID=A0A8J3AFE7_9ACTN|nr:hypothetical protein [Egicoccus halophilus]GGI07285.1 hypothetical protein GCM10011354_23320 [Egicoccus halophilus]